LVVEASMTDTGRLFLARELSHNLSFTSSFLEDHFNQHSQFPDSLQELPTFAHSANYLKDPYTTTDRGIYGYTRDYLSYNKVATATGEVCYLYTVKFDGPAKIISGNSTTGKVTASDNPEFEAYRRNVIMKEATLAVLPEDATFYERRVYLVNKVLSVFADWRGRYYGQGKNAFPADRNPRCRVSRQSHDTASHRETEVSTPSAKNSLFPLASGYLKLKAWPNRG